MREPLGIQNTIIISLHLFQIFLCIPLDQVTKCMMKVPKKSTYGQMVVRGVFVPMFLLFSFVVVSRDGEITSN